MSDQDQTITTAVREHYAAIARTVLADKPASCCGPSSAQGTSTCCGTPAAETKSSCCGGSEAVELVDPSAANLYALDELQGLPLKAALASLGCGNPTALAELRPGEVVLDLGSGGGIDVLLSARRVGPTGFAYGLDMTDEMLELARRNAAEAGATNVEFLKGDIANIPLPDASVDVIVSNCVINLAADKAPVLREAFRVLKPGGRFAVSDIVIHGGLPANLTATADLRRDMSAWAGCIAGALTDAEYRAGLAAAGFGDIRLEITQRYDLADVRDMTGGLVERLGTDTAREVVSRFASTFVRAKKPQ